MRTNIVSTISNWTEVQHNANRSPNFSLQDFHSSTTEQHFSYREFIFPFCISILSIFSKKWRHRESVKHTQSENELMEHTRLSQRVWWPPPHPKTTHTRTHKHMSMAFSNEQTLDWWYTEKEINYLIEISQMMAFIENTHKQKFELMTHTEASETIYVRVAEIPWCIPVQRLTRCSLKYGNWNECWLLAHVHEHGKKKNKFVCSVRTRKERKRRKYER